MALTIDASPKATNYDSSRNDYPSDDNSSNPDSPTQDDRAILQEEEQQEILLGREAPSGAHSGFPESSRRERRKARKQKRKGRRRKGKAADYEDGSLMYEMEEGVAKDNEGWQSSSSSLDVDVLKQQSKLKV